MVSIAFDEYGAKKLVKRAIAVIPNTDPTITLQLVTPTTIKKTAEKKISNLFVSPIEPGIHPTNMFDQEKSKTKSVLALFKSSTAFWLVLPAGILNAVGPEYPSGASAHTLSRKYPLDM